MPEQTLPYDVSYILNSLGEERSAYYQAVSPPIMQTSNFAFRRVEELREILKDEYEGYLYSRGLNPTIDILRKKLAALDGAEDCLVFNSGSSAIYAAVLSQVRSGDHIVSVKNPYTWAQKMFDKVLPRFKVHTTYVNGTDVGNFEAALTPQTRLIYLESPNSWTYDIQDLRAVAELAKTRGIVTVCDNSYSTPLFQQPLSFGIDMAIQSASKYISGHSDVVAGVLTGSRQLMKQIFEGELLNMGNGISPFNAWLLIRGLRTLPVRLSRISATTREIVQFFKQRPEVEEVLFPLDEQFPQYELANKQMKGACGLLSVVMRSRKQEDIVRFCESLEHFLIGVSWGGHESLIMPRCAGFAANEFDPDNREHRMMRIYIGLEDADFLIKDLERAFG